VQDAVQRLLRMTAKPTPQHAGDALGIASVTALSLNAKK
jgi:Holliday junction resolvasome RuvABC endonuclease subunit